MIHMLAPTTDLAQGDPMRLVRLSSALNILDFDTDQLSHVIYLTFRKSCCNSLPIFPFRVSATTTTTN
jgi:hypothetical protein